MEQLLSPSGLDSSPEGSPAGTPDEERYLTRPRAPSSKSGAKAAPLGLWAKRDKYLHALWRYTPVTLILISIAQVVTHCVCVGRCPATLRYSPATLRAGELYRLLSYCLLHADVAHVLLDVALQLALGGALAAEQGARHLPLYLAGGVAGALAAREPLVGASACVYALLGGHLAHLYLNFSSLKFRLYRLFSISFLVFCDVCLCVYHELAISQPEPGTPRVSVSVGAHGAGGAAGALLGLVLLKGPAPTWLRTTAGLGLLVTITVGALTTIYGTNK